MASESLVYRIMADNKRLKKDLARAKGQLSGFQRQSNQVSSQIKSQLKGMFAIGTVVAFGRALAKTTEDYDKQAKAIAQVEQGLISTGAASGRTLNELTKMAEELQKTTLFGDEEILKDATAQLLTFTNIAGENFDRTQKAALDLATRLDGDLKSSSIQLGKALNDPVANLSALSRSGIQFSKEQTAVIKSLAQTNRLAEAQTIILDELANQYGGSSEAAAMAGTGGWKQLSNSFGDLREQLGELIAENSGSKGLAAWLKSITEDVHDVTRALNSNLTGWQKFQMVALKAIGNATGTTIAYAEALEATGNALKDQEEQTRSDEAAQKAATVARQRQVETVRQQTKALRELQAVRQNISQVQSKGMEVDPISGAVPMGLSTVKAEELFKQQREQIQQKYADYAAFMISQNEMLTAIVRDSLGAAISGFAEGLATDGLAGALNNIAQVFADGISRIGDQLIAYGVMMVAAKKALANPFSNPAAAIAAGVAAKLAAAALKSAISSNSGRISAGLSGGGGGSGQFTSGIQGQSVSIQPKPILVKFENGSLTGMMEFENNRRARTR